MLRPGLDFEIPTVEILEKYLEAKWESEGLGLKKKESIICCFFLLLGKPENLESFGRRSNSKVLLSNSSNPSFVDLIWFFVHWRCRGLWEHSALEKMLRPYPAQSLRFKTRKWQIFCTWVQVFNNFDYVLRSLLIWCRQGFNIQYMSLHLSLSLYII